LEEWAVGLRFLAPHIPGMIFDQLYSRRKRKGTKDAVFLVKIDNLFICLTVFYAIRCDAGSLESFRIRWLLHVLMLEVR